MADLQFTLDEEKIQEALFGDRGMEVLMESVLNQVLQSEMTDHLGAQPEERTGGRSGYLTGGSYERELTTRVGRLELEVPRDRDGTFSTQLFERYQRSEKALVLSLMQMVVQGVGRARPGRVPVFDLRRFAREGTQAGRCALHHGATGGGCHR